MRIHDGNSMDRTDFSSDQYIKINSCGFQNMKNGCRIIRENGRQDYHILLLNAGGCRAFYDGESYELEKGNFVIYEPFGKQEYILDGESSSLWCHFTGSAVKEILSSCNLKGGVYLKKTSKAVFDSFAEMIQRFNEPTMEKLANASLMELIYGLEKDVENDRGNEKTKLMLPVLTYININYQKELSVKELSEKSGYSQSRFSHLFSEITGTTPIKYQNDIRLKTASEMLLSTNETITEIALSCGFSDPLYFSRLFKRKYNVSPTEYRGKK